MLYWCHNCGPLVAGPLALGGVGTMRQCGAAQQLSGASWRGHITLISRGHVTRDGGGARDAGHVTQHVVCAVRRLVDRISCDHHQRARSPEAGGGEWEVEATSELNETWAAGSSEQQQQQVSSNALQSVGRSLLSRVGTRRRRCLLLDQSAQTKSGFKDLWKQNLQSIMIFVDKLPNFT